MKPVNAEPALAPVQAGLVTLAQPADTHSFPTYNRNSNQSQAQGTSPNNALAIGGSSNVCTLLLRLVIARSVVVVSFLETLRSKQPVVNRHRWQGFDALFVQLQEYHVVRDMVDLRDGDCYVFLAPQVPFAQHQVRDLCGLRVD